MFDLILFGPKFWWTHIFWTQIFFLIENFFGLTFFGSKLCRTQNCLYPKFLLDSKCFWTQNFFGLKMVWTLFSLHNFFWTLNFFLPLMFFGPLFLPNNFVDPKFFLTQIFFDQKSILDPKSFLTQFFGRKNDWDPKSFWTNNFVLDQWSNLSTRYYQQQNKMSFDTNEINIVKHVVKSRAYGLVWVSLVNLFRLFQIRFLCC